MLYDAALQEVAEASVDMEDARNRHYAIKATINDTLPRFGHTMPGDDDGSE